MILNRRVGADAVDTADLHRLTYLLESGSDRIGALDFQASPTHYAPRAGDHASLDELARAAEQVERGVPLSPALERRCCTAARSAAPAPRRSCTTASDS